MRETPQEIAELQRLFDRIMAKINPHFAAIVTPKRRLTAQQVCAYLQGTRIVAFSTVHRPQARRSHVRTGSVLDQAFYFFESLLPGQVNALDARFPRLGDGAATRQAMQAGTLHLGGRLKTRDATRKPT